MLQQQVRPRFHLTPRVVLPACLAACSPPACLPDLPGAGGSPDGSVSRGHWHPEAIPLPDARQVLQPPRPLGGWRTLSGTNGSRVAPSRALSISPKVLQVARVFFGQLSAPSG